MKKNLHPMDRLLRGVIGITIIGFLFLNNNYLQEPILDILLGLFSILNLISFLTGWCPVYYLAKVSSRKKT
jgi:hypothetical protein